MVLDLSKSVEVILGNSFDAKMPVSDKPEFKMFKVFQIPLKVLRVLKDCIISVKFLALFQLSILLL